MQIWIALCKQFKIIAYDVVFGIGFVLYVQICKEMSLILYIYKLHYIVKKI